MRDHFQKLCPLWQEEVPLAQTGDAPWEVRGGSASEVPHPQNGGVSPSNSKVKGAPIPPPPNEEERVAPKGQGEVTLR